MLFIFLLGTNHKSQLTNHKSQVTNHKLPVTIFFYEKTETNLVATSELGKKLAGLEEDAGGGGAGTGGRRHGGAGAAATRARRTCGSAAKKIRVPPGDKTPSYCIAFP